MEGPGFDSRSVVLFKKHTMDKIKLTITPDNRSAVEEMVMSIHFALIGIIKMEEGEPESDEFIKGALEEANESLALLGLPIDLSIDKEAFNS